MTQQIIILDTHVDIPWPERTDKGLPDWHGIAQDDIWSLETLRHFTIPKAQKGNLNAVCLAAYIPQSSLSSEGYEAAWLRVQAMLQTITKILDNDSDACLCSTVNQIRQAAFLGKVAIIPVIENGYALGEDTARVELLARQYGVRYITLTHNGHNQLADSAIERGGTFLKHGGLSALGKEMIMEMNRHGIVIDVSHSSKDSMMQAVHYSRTPVVASHSCVRSLCDHPRNLDDEQLDYLCEAGGVVHITAMGAFLKKGGGTLDDLVHHISYAVRRMGIEHVGFSSDFDGGGGIEGWRDASQTHHVIEKLKQAGFDESERRALCGGNMLRLLEKAESAAVR